MGWRPPPCSGTTSGRLLSWSWGDGEAGGLEKGDKGGEEEQEERGDGGSDGVGEGSGNGNGPVWWWGWRCWSLAGTAGGTGDPVAVHRISSSRSRDPRADDDDDEMGGGVASRGAPAAACPSSPCWGGGSAVAAGMCRDSEGAGEEESARRCRPTYRSHAFSTGAKELRHGSPGVSSASSGGSGVGLADG